MHTCTHTYTHAHTDAHMHTQLLFMYEVALALQLEGNCFSWWRDNIRLKPREKRERQRERERGERVKEGGWRKG